MELQKKLDAMRENMKIVHSCTWSDPGSRARRDRIADNDKSCEAIDATANVESLSEDEVFIEWLGKVGSEEEIAADVNDETILLQPVEVKVPKKGVKYRVKKLLRCCAPCIKPKVV